MEDEKQPQKKTRWTNPHHEGDYEYVNSMSKSPWPVLLWTILLSGGFYIFAFFRYREMVAWEKSGGTIRMASLEKLSYDIGGTWLFPLLVALLATILLIAGIRTFRHRWRLTHDDDAK